MQAQEFEWPGRAWILAGFLALAGLAFYFVVDDDVWPIDNPQLRNALATFIAVGALSFALALERIRWQWVAGFALIWGLILAFVAYSTILVESRGGAINYSFLSGLLAVTIALPLFQTMHKYGERVLPYADLHGFAWRNIVSGFASVLFVGISFMLANLLAALFNLIGIDLLRELLRKEWFSSMFVGASFGAALGVLKEHQRIVSSIQGLVMTVLSILAPVLAVALVLFLVALPFTGLQAFWDATRQTTPILMSCAIGAVILANAIIRDTNEDESQHRVMRPAAVALAVCVLPLSVIACLSMSQRIEQYALTPDRIWGMITVLIGVAYGAAYVWSLASAWLRDRSAWSDNLRGNNTRLAIGLCLLALVLSFGLVDFGKISVGSQLARVTDGDLNAEELDVTAFAFDFGPAGREALAEMEQSANASLAKAAGLALAAENRWSLENVLRENNLASLASAELIVYPQQIDVPKELRSMINQRPACLSSACLLIWEQGSDTARLVSPDCTRWGQYGFNPNTKSPPDKEGFEHCSPTVATLTRVKGNWQDLGPHAFMVMDETSDEIDADKQAITEAMRNGDFEIRTVERKQLFLGGKPVGDAFR